jgi:hypothetical protein
MPGDDWGQIEAAQVRARREDDERAAALRERRYRLRLSWGRPPADAAEAEWRATAPPVLRVLPAAQDGSLPNDPTPSPSEALSRVLPPSTGTWEQPTEWGAGEEWRNRPKPDAETLRLWAAEIRRLLAQQEVK